MPLTQTAKPAIELPTETLAAFCDKWQVLELALFGSVLRDDFGSGSDVDVVVRFAPTARPTLLDLGAMEGELERIFGRSVDLLEREGVERMGNPYLRRSILDSARVVYAR